MMRVLAGSTDFLLVIDVQNDFCPGGSLPVPDGHKIVPILNELGKRFDHVILAQDWHPPGHSSFASQHEGAKPFETVDTLHGRQSVWPDHCVQNTKGAEFHPELALSHAEGVVRKGYDKNLDSFSAFIANDDLTPSGLHGYLQERGCKRVFVGGLAFETCVKMTALHAHQLGYEVFVVRDASGAVNIDGSEEQALAAFAQRGIDVINSVDVERYESV